MGDELAALLSAVDRLLTAGDVDAVVRRAVEVARSHIGLQRAGIFLVDPLGEHMLGTWGTDLDGQVVDEHHMAFELDAATVDVFQRAEISNQPFILLDGWPIGARRAEGVTVRGDRSVACTPIRSSRGRIGILYNDVGLSGAPLDESKQMRAAILCAVLGGVVELARAFPRAEPSVAPPVRHPALQSAIKLLAGDPTLARRQLAASAGIGEGQLGRLFKAELGVSLVRYRNRLRVERLQTLFAAGDCNLSQAARAAGFGSYAQFHRVFRAVYGVAPRDYVRSVERD